MENNNFSLWYHGRRHDTRNLNVPDAAKLPDNHVPASNSLVFCTDRRSFIHKAHYHLGVTSTSTLLTLSNYSKNRTTLLTPVGNGKFTYKARAKITGLCIIPLHRRRSRSMAGPISKKCTSTIESEFGSRRTHRKP